MNILVVDDDSVIRMLMRTLLTSEGYTVITASDGEDALLKLSASPVDLLITDIYMPRIDGIKLRSIVREMKGFEKLPVLFISGYTDQITLGSVRNAELEGFFRKGRPLTELLTWLRYLSAPAEGKPPYPSNSDTLLISPQHLTDRRQRLGRSETL